jgi:alpha-galactosidase
MTFGLWIEPEMVNPDSDLFRAHPEWILRYANREVISGRNQYILDLSNEDVLVYLKDCFDTLLLHNNIAYVKWDMNRFVSEMGSSLRPPSEFKEMWHGNAQGVHELRSYLLHRYPQVEFEACASGGGRVNYSSIADFDEFWVSDNTDPLDRLLIQEDYSLFYPVKCMRAWLTDDYYLNNRRIPMRFGLHCAMCGAFGIGVNLHEKNAEEKNQITQAIHDYKNVRETIQLGELERLKSLKHDEIQAIQYTRGNQVVLFAFLLHEKFGKTNFVCHLRHLDPEAIYRFELGETTYEKSGAYLMYNGLMLTLKGDYDSLMIVISCQ